MSIYHYVRPLWTNGLLAGSDAPTWVNERIERHMKSKGRRRNEGPVFVQRDPDHGLTIASLRCRVAVSDESETAYRSATFYHAIAISDDGAGLQGPVDLERAHALFCDFYGSSIVRGVELRQAAISQMAHPGDAKAALLRFGAGVRPGAGWSHAAEPKRETAPPHRERRDRRAVREEREEPRIAFEPPAPPSPPERIVAPDLAPPPITPDEVFDFGDARIGTPFQELQPPPAPARADEAPALAADPLPSLPPARPYPVDASPEEEPMSGAAALEAMRAESANRTPGPVPPPPVVPVTDGRSMSSLLTARCPNLVEEMPEIAWPAPETA